MERLTIRFKALAKALKTLEKTIKKMRTPLDEEIHAMIRDSLIKRFEYCYEASWQLLKQILDQKYSLTVLGTSSIFKESARMNLITQDELKILLLMIHARNQTSHTYKEETAKQIANDIPTYYEVMNIILKRLEKEQA